MRVAPPRTTKTPSPGKWNRNREAHRADCVRIVHLLRHSLEFVAYKDRKAVAAALKEIYRAVDATAGEAALAAFEAAPGAPNTRPLPRVGDGPGARWCRSMPSPLRCAGC